MDRIVVDARVHFGKPCVAGTRITVQDVLELVEQDLPFDQIIQNYHPELTIADIHACVRYPDTTPGRQVMTTFNIREYRESDQDAVVTLWRECGLVRPWNDPVKDIHRKLRVRRDLFLVGILDDRLVATVMAGYEGHRGWINYLAVARDCRGRGIGRRLMDEAEARLLAIGCPKINLQIRRSNTDAVEFYRSLGFSVDDSLSMGKRLVED